MKLDSEGEISPGRHVEEQEGAGKRGKSFSLAPSRWFKDPSRIGKSGIRFPRGILERTFLKESLGWILFFFLEFILGAAGFGFFGIVKIVRVLELERKWIGFLPLEDWGFKEKWSERSLKC